MAEENRGIYEAIPKIMGDIGAISKNKTAQTAKGSAGYKFRGIDDVMNHINPALVKHGVFVVPTVESHEREERQTASGNHLIYSIMRVNYKFYASDGSFISCTTIGEGMDSGDKSSNKAMSIAFKYACFQTFCIPTEEMEDPDASIPPESVPVPAPAPEPEPVYKCADCGKEFKGYHFSDGRQMTAQQVYEAATGANPDHVARCRDCRLKKEAAEGGAV